MSFINLTENSEVGYRHPRPVRLSGILYFLRRWGTRQTQWGVFLRVVEGEEGVNGHSEVMD